VMGPESTPKTLAHNIYSIAYQFYGRKFNLERYESGDVIFSFLSRFLHAENGSNPTLRARLSFYWNQRVRRRDANNGNGSVLSVLREEAHRLIWDDPRLAAILHNGKRDRANLDEKWFDFVNSVSDKVLCHFADHIIDSVAGAHFLNLFDSLGSAGALYAILAPYFVSYSLFSRDRQFTQSVLERLGHSAAASRDRRVNIAHFTDTLYEVNGVAGTLKKQIEAAHKYGKSYTVITCNAEDRADSHGIRNFKPISAYELAVYPEQKLFYPPFLEMLDYCYQERFTHIHSATPGPLGLAALAIARILRLPIVGTYHTALPQYAQYLTDDASVAEIVWKYVIWYYEQMDLIYVPSASTAAELISKGISESKVKLFPRGVDTSLFNPARRNGCFSEYGVEAGKITILYVGRVSKEKNLELLVRAFSKLSHSTKNVCLVVVGDGPYLNEMRRALEGTPAVFTGYLEGEALASVYASADLFVFPSTTDTFGNVVLEAQASGIPVIVTDSGGPQENIIPGKTGIVVKGDDEEGLLDGIRNMIADPERLRAMGRAARAYAEKRSFDRAFEATWKLYADPVHGRG
ncbi:MAG: glycosyltransferase family 1 protein, partial [Desulfomonile sp.]|nr:glycosyltransferase family 1 protein [Desulfomonile sp.]